jgi:hypothetical protein
MSHIYNRASVLQGCCSTMQLVMKMQEVWEKLDAAHLLAVSDADVLAPASTNRRAQRRLPARAAQCNGVTPSSFVESAQCAAQTGVTILMLVTRSKYGHDNAVRNCRS